MEDLETVLHELSHVFVMQNRDQCLLKLSKEVVDIGTKIGFRADLARLLTQFVKLLTSGVEEVGISKKSLELPTSVMRFSKSGSFSECETTFLKVSSSFFQASGSPKDESKDQKFFPALSIAAFSCTSSSRATTVSSTERE
jgi:hypothetical protein